MKRHAFTLTEVLKNRHIKVASSHGGDAIANVDFDVPVRQPSPAPRKPEATGTIGPAVYPLIALCRCAGLPEPVPEYQFHPTRKWRFDYAWPLHKLALEIEGGIWTQGRHTRGKGALEDMRKYSEAAVLGWRLLYVTPDEANSVGLDYVKRALA